jgi:hypothetical protein
MTWVMKIFLLALKLYPRSFRARFSAEMEEVFHAGLVEACEQGEQVGFILREMLHLPVSLVDVYIWSMRSSESGPMAISSVGGGGTVRVSMPGEGWGASFMAGLPHLVIGIFIVCSALIGAVMGTNQNAFGHLQMIVYSLLLLGVLVFCIYKGWKHWSASWMVYMFIFAISLLSTGMNALRASIKGRTDWLYGFLMILIPLVLAYLLYKIACKDRLRGLLAAVPPMVLIWAYFQEFVPVLPQSLAWGWLFMLAFTSTVMMLRTKRFSAALGLAMVVPILGGFPFAYLGVYMGGTLPFSEPGPSLQEVFRQYIPFLAMVLTLVLGPQLAVKLRSLGHESAEAGGKIFYRLALGGLLLGLVFTLVECAIMTNGVSILHAIRQGLLIAAVVLYLVGFALLQWATYQSKLPSSDNSNLLELAALFLPILFVPIVIFLAIPIPMGSNTKSWLLPVAEIGWVIATTLVVKD